MKCFEFDLNNIINITMLNKYYFKDASLHMSRICPEYIMYFMVSGYMRIENAGGDLTLKAGDCYLFKKGDFQRPLESSECEYFFVHFSTPPKEEFEISEEDFRELVLNKKNPFTVYLKQRNKIESGELLSYISSTFKSNKISSINTAEDVLKSFSAFADILYKLEGIGIREKEGVKGYAVVKRISDFINEHYKEDFTSDYIKEKFKLNYDYANRIFSKIKGVSIMAYRNKVRISVAKDEMTASGKSISEIAREVGFEDNCYFSRCFKKIEGISPTEFRERMLKNDNL